MVSLGVATRDTGNDLPLTLVGNMDCIMAQSHMHRQNKVHLEKPTLSHTAAACLVICRILQEN